MNKHLSEIISMALEPIAHAADGSDIDSTGELLEKICNLNKKRREGSLETQENEIFSMQIVSVK